MKNAISAAITVAALSLLSATAASARDGCGRHAYRDDDGWCVRYRVIETYRAPPLYSYRVYDDWRPRHERPWGYRGYHHSDYDRSDYGFGYVDFNW